MKNTKHYMVMAIMPVIILAGCSFVASSPEAGLARCVKDKGIKMYGLTWCSYCIKERQAFGDEAWKSFPFVDCQEDKTQCQRAGVEEYPTWFFPNGSITRKGYISPEMLAGFAGCPYTKEEAEDKAE